MKNKSTFLLLCALLVFITACKKDPEVSKNDQLPADYVAFGHFHGFCVGDDCIAMFRVTGNALYENSVDAYPDLNTTVNGSFYKQTDVKFQQVKDFEQHIPAQLLSESNQVFGIPDVTDGGGIYIEVSKNGIRQYWYLDKIKANVPPYLHVLIDYASAQINLLNQ